MKPIKGYNTATASGQYERLAPGGYILKITEVRDEEDKQRLVYLYDIAEGPEKGRYATEKMEFRHSFYAYYTEKAVGLFKSFIQAIDETNGTELGKTVENGLNEQLLVGKLLGAVIAYEEYDATDGTTKQRPYVSRYLTADKVRQGAFKIPELKRAKGSAAAQAVPSGFTPMKDEDVPF